MIRVIVTLELDGAENVATVELYGALTEFLEGSSFWAQVADGSERVSVVIDSAMMSARVSPAGGER
jgi:hypothetical protein